MKALGLGLFLGIGSLQAGAWAGPAIIGEGVETARERDYPQFCRIEIDGSFDDQSNGCSGTLVGPREIATSAHCFGRGYSGSPYNVKAYCGGRMVRVQKVHLPADHLWINAQRPFPSVDYARIELQSELPNWMPKVSKPELYFDEAGNRREGVQCWMAGFGTSRWNTFGTLHLAELTRYQLRYEAGAITLKESDGRHLRVSADHGDSGGPLYCRAPGKSMELVGVIVLYLPERNRDDRRIHNLFAAIWLQNL